MPLSSELLLFSPDIDSFFFSFHPLLLIAYLRKKKKEKKRAKKNLNSMFDKLHNGNREALS